MLSSFLISLIKCFNTLLSKSSPPRCVSPDVLIVSNTPSSIDKILTSKVPPPKSKTKIVYSPFFKFNS
jgi:hypothetical protein